MSGRKFGFRLLAFSRPDRLLPIQVLGQWAKEGLKRHSERTLNKRLGVKQTLSMLVPGPSGLLRPMEGPEHSIMNR